MAVPVRVTEAPGTKAQQTALTLTSLVILLGVLASAGGLFIPGLYRDTPYMVSQAVGQDLVTLLVAVPGLAISQYLVRRGSARATLAWIGLLGYMLYTYTTFAFGAAFNELFLVYVALFSLAVAAFAAALCSLDAAVWRGRFGAATPRRSVAAFLALSGLMVTGLWLPEVLRFVATGKLPAALVLADIPTSMVYVMDLGVVVPLAFLTAVWLWRRQTWGYLLAGVILTKMTTLGLALLSMTAFMVRDGAALEAAPTAVGGVVALGGLSLLVWFYRHCHS